MISEAARSRVEHLEAKVQQNLTRRLYGANGQSPGHGALWRRGFLMEWISRGIPCPAYTAKYPIPATPVPYAMAAYTIREECDERTGEYREMEEGEDRDPLHRAIGSGWLISAVARIYRPGAKADCCLILEGPQGIRKSTALRTIAGEYFTDELADLGSKDAAMQTRGVWIIELSELDNLSHAEVARIKAFMSRTTDRFRPPCGMRLVESPRQCVFAGTVNHSSYLRDETGGRRFWPVVCGPIDVDALASDRDQLWAEAKVRFESGSAWWLDTLDLVQLASDQQEARYEGDPWEEVIGPWLESKESTTISEVLEKCINKPQAQWTQTDKVRAARCLRAQGWLRYRERQGSRLEWRYRKAA